MKRAALAGALVCVLLLAGCSGFADGGSQSEAGVDGNEGATGVSSANVTPAPVPTIEPTPDPPTEVAPGITEAGVRNASALARAHDAILEDTNYTVIRNVTYRAANGTVLTHRRSVSRVGTDGRRCVGRTWREATGLRREAVWSSGERLLRARTYANGTRTYRRTEFETADRGRAIGAGTGSGQIDRVFTVAEVRVVDRYEHNGTVLYRLVSASAARSGTSATDRSDRDGRAVSAEALVTIQGLVRSYEFQQTLSDDLDGTTRIVVSTRYVDVGTTTVERPPWYDDALRATNGTKSTTASAAIGPARGEKR